jgi:hypothetical protein
MGHLNRDWRQKSQVEANGHAAIGALAVMSNMR